MKPQQIQFLPILQLFCPAPIESSKPILQCPQRVVVPCTNPEGMAVSFTVTGRTPCGADAAVQCVPPSGSLFKVGTTQVNCTATSSGGGTATCSFPVMVNCLTLTPSSPGTVTIAWTGGTLESAVSVTGPWLPVLNVRSPFNVRTSDRQRFFRVRLAP